MAIVELSRSRKRSLFKLWLWRFRPGHWPELKRGGCRSPIRIFFDGEGRTEELHILIGWFTLILWKIQPIGKVILYHFLFSFSQIPFFLLSSDTFCPTMSSRCDLLRTQAFPSLLSSVFLCIRSTSCTFQQFALLINGLFHFWQMLQKYPNFEFELSIRSTCFVFILQYDKQT